MGVAYLRFKNGIKTRVCSTSILYSSTKKWMLSITGYLVKMPYAQLRSIAKSDQVHDLMSKSGIKGGNCSISFLNINNGLHNILKCRCRDFKIIIGHVTWTFVIS